jgi:formate-dependent nitrite reductase cytochrome c552 subunit
MGKARLVKGLGILTMALATAALAYSLTGRTRSIYLPGPTTAGHYQIEMACDDCHSDVFSDAKTLQAACVRCHGEELEVAIDTHPEAKFTDPRNADRVAQLDARTCVTCHREHRPELVSTMGLSLPTDYCYRCHEGIAKERPSHQDMPFDTCANASCHNFHDNRALYEDFLARHLDDPDHVIDGKVLALAAPDRAKALKASDAVVPAGVPLDPNVVRDWAETAHAAGGVDCNDCHTPKKAKGTSWTDAVDDDRCGACHEQEKKGFLSGRHGMKAAAGLGPMRVADARLPMKQAARDRSLGCTSCHGAHRFDTRRAAVDACLECHAARHSESYTKTEHASRWREDPSGRSGASCATCHLPRQEHGKKTVVVHNQNDTLRPNEKMVRPICSSCHGVGFSLAALASTRLVDNNFNGSTEGRVQSLDLVRARLAAH